MLQHNWLALLVTSIIALTWLRSVDWFAHKGFISSQDSRKIIHIGTGPIYIICWLFFNEDISSRFYAAMVPLAITLQFLLVGLGVIKDQASVKAMSRSGDRREILKGPLFYGLVFVIITLVYWKNSLIGIVALMLVCGGDGFADIFGSRFGKRFLPWSRSKTYAGSISMFIGSLVFSLGILAIFHFAQLFILDFSALIPKVVLVCLVGTLVESLSISDIDNVTVPLAAVVLGHILFG